MGPLKIQLPVSVLMVKPTDHTNVSCHANTKTQMFTTNINDDGIFEMIDQSIIQSKFFQQVVVDSLFGKSIIWMSTLPNFLLVHSKKQKVILLLLLTDGLISFYCLITNFHAFMAVQW